MKKINQYIIAAAIPLLGMLAACTDGNDWTVDSSAARQRTPDGLAAEVDEATLEIDLKWNKAAGASGYEIQISESPLSEGFDDTEGIPTFVSRENSWTIDRLNGQIEIKENTTYYVRVRALSETKKPSKWITDDITSGKFKVNTPAMLWIDDTGVGETTLTMKWHEIKYANPSVIINENTGELYDLGEEEKEAMTYTATGLNDGEEYTFILLDEEGNQIGKAIKSTEKAPNMELAREIMNLSGFVSGGTAVLTDEQFGDFVVTMNDQASKYKGENKDIRMISPTNIVGEKVTYYRFNTNTKEMATPSHWDVEKGDYTKNYIKLSVPAKGRIYIYAYTGTAGRTMNVGYRVNNDGQISETVVWDGELDSNLKDNAKEGEAVNYIKVYADQPGDYFINCPVGAIYIYGFIFVPDE